MPTPTADIKNSWYIPLIRTSQDKSTPRLGVMPEKMAELVGVDGTVQGGLRPLSGFTEVQELDWFSDPKHDYTSNILDWDATSFRIGSEDYGYGAVYKAERKKEPRPTPPTVMSSYSASHGTSPGVLYLEVADVVVTSGDSIVCSVFNWGTVQTTNVAWAEDGQLFEQIVNSNDDPGARANPPKQAMYILKNPAPGTNTVTAYFTGEEEGVAMSLSVIQGLDHDQPIVNSQFLRQDAAVNAYEGTHRHYQPHRDYGGADGADGGGGGGRYVGAAAVHVLVRHGRDRRPEPDHPAGRERTRQLLDLLLGATVPQR
jgi:hypothetical protein